MVKTKKLKLSPFSKCTYMTIPDSLGLLKNHEEIKDKYIYIYVYIVMLNFTYFAYSFSMHLVI